MRGLVVAFVVALAAGADAQSVPDLAAHVNPFVGTAPRTRDFGTGGGAGNTFPGATAPFGMLQWSPDTVPGAVNVGGGYDWADTKLRGFSLTHLSGPGCAIFWDVPILPTTVPLDVSPATAGSYAVRPDFVPSFRHDDEEAAPGWYRVRLDPDGPRAIDVALAARTRTGVGRFAFPPAESAAVLFNAGGSAMANSDVALAVDPTLREVSGSVSAGQFCYHRNRYTLHFAVRFDTPFDGWGTWTDDVLAPGSRTVAQHTDAPFQLRFLPEQPSVPPATNATQTGAWVSFDATAGAVVTARVGISFASVDGARRNLDAESPDFDVERARDETRAAWNDLLGRVVVEGGTPALTRTFYTMLYRALLAPTVFSDVDGTYRGMDGGTHTAEGFTKYANVSGWDVYRSAFPLQALLVPRRASDIVASLLADARESGWLPRWPVADGQTDVMVGDPAAPMIAAALALGAGDFDRPAALAALVKGATQTGRSPNADYVERQGLDGYLAHGFVPHDGTEGSSGITTSIFGDAGDVWGSVATTLEYGIADFAIARVAAAQGDQATAEAFLRRSGAWSHLFDPATGFVRPRYASGAFLEPFDPLSLDGFAEGNAVQYSWLVPFDPAGLFAAMGGRKTAAARLDAHVERLNEGPASPHAFLGNEPQLGVPWLYDWLGQPWKTQALVRRTLLELFDDGPSGYPGNDDLGAMSAWWVFGALGMYPAVPGESLLALASPLFPRTTLRLAGGDVEIRASGAAAESPYLRRLVVNGRTHGRPWLCLRQLARGARVKVRLGATPTRWGAGKRAPSFPADGPLRRGSCRLP